MGVGKRLKAGVSVLINYWGLGLWAGIGLILASSVLCYKLATLVPGFSDGEITVRGQTALLSNIKTNPLYAPHSSLQFLLQHFKHHGPAAMRLPGVLIGLIVIVCFYCVLAKWYSQRVAILGTLLLSTSSWFLHTVRLSTPDTTFLLLFVFFACGVWLHHARTSRLALLATCAAFVSLLYIPAMIWFILPVLAWQLRRILGTRKNLPLWQLVILILLTIATLLPLGWALISQPGLYKAWLGLPAHWPSLAHIGKNFSRIPGQLIWRGPADSSKWLGRLPLLDWFGVVMLMIGAYTYWFKLRLDRTWFLIYVAVLGSALIAIGGPLQLSVLLPFVYLIIAAGIALMLQQWFTVFPTNPFARSVGAVLLTTAVLMSSFYQLNHYFVAWPHTPETKAAFHQKP